MRYFYDECSVPFRNHKCEHPLYRQCTLYFKENLGLAVVKKHYNERLKMFWFGPIENTLAMDISRNEKFKAFFDENACEGCDDIFPTFDIRKIMWALRMKPLRKQYWELSIEDLNAEITTPLIEKGGIEK